MADNLNPNEPTTNEPTTNEPTSDRIVKPEDLMFDGSAIAAYARDLPPGGLSRLRTAQKGINEAIAEILKNQPKVGRKVGITDQDIQSILLKQERIAEIDTLIPDAKKALEIMIETRAALDDELQQDISAIAALVDTRIKKFRQRELLAMYAQTRAYRSLIAQKAARTRRKNAAAAALAAVNNAQVMAKAAANKADETAETAAE